MTDKSINLMKCEMCECEDVHFDERKYSYIWVECGNSECQLKGRVGIRYQEAADRWNKMQSLIAAGKVKTKIKGEVK